MHRKEGLMLAGDSSGARQLLCCCCTFPTPCTLLRAPTPSSPSCSTKPASLGASSVQLARGSVSTALQLVVGATKRAASAAPLHTEEGACAVEGSGRLVRRLLETLGRSGSRPG